MHARGVPAVETGIENDKDLQKNNKHRDFFNHSIHLMFAAYNLAGNLFRRIGRVLACSTQQNYGEHMKMLLH